ncbi:hypothetical protein C9993_04745 [Marinobacter sp. Z-F4-2]|nr:hypothetical protein C9993_04745 [Marinobacter sp. Z-F4-2]
MVKDISCQKSFIFEVPRFTNNILKMLKKISFSTIFIVSGVYAETTRMEDPTSLKLIDKGFVLSNYVGSFKVEYSDEFSTISYNSGRIAYNPLKNSIFIDSHVYQLGIGEFQVPEQLSLSLDENLLPDASNLQPFVPVFNRTDTGSTDGIDRIGGMAIVKGELVVQGYDTYDANGDVRQTTAVVRDISKIASSEIDGMYEMEGAARTVNYISPVPYEWRGLLGGPFLAGNGGGMSIVTRNSEGPSLYIFDDAELNGNDWRVPTKLWMNFPVEHALSTKLYPDRSFPEFGDWDVTNNSGINDLWTEASVAAFAFIVPNTRTFMVVGSSGMHESGGGYKIVNDAGYQCGGFCARDNNDYNTYYWLFDLKEIIEAANPWAVLPYDYGIFDDRWVKYNAAGAQGLISGGSFDLKSGTLMLSFNKATSNKDSAGTIVSVYKLPFVSQPKPPANLKVQ